MIRIRKLEERDIPFMLEWMQDANIIKYFQISQNQCDWEHAKKFVRQASMPKEVTHNIHMAVVDETDEYLGTISLKNIDIKNRNAEYAISMRMKTWGTGCAQEATSQIIELAFKKLKLQRIYLNVFSDNYRAIAFYEKVGFKYEGELKNHIYCNNSYKSLKWYALLSEGHTGRGENYEKSC